MNTLASNDKNKFPYKCNLKDGTGSFYPTMIDYLNEMVWEQIGQASESGCWHSFDEVSFEINEDYIPPYGESLFYYEWGNEKSGFVSVARYDENDVLIYEKQMKKELILKYKIPFHNPYS